MFIITAVGPDRPGMAHAVAEVLSGSDYNIEDTTMTRLSGEFAMILIVSPPAAASIESLTQQLAPLEQSHGLFINVRPIPDAVRAQSTLGERYILSVYGPESKGLVARVTGVLARHGVNISDVQTRVASGGAMYVMLYELEVPPTLDKHALTSELEAAAKAIGAQISLRVLEENTL